MGICNSMPRCCNRVQLEELGSGVVVTMTDPVSMHLKYLDRGEDLVLEQVVDLQVGAEGVPLGLEGYSLSVGDVAAAYGCLHSADITDERTLVGR